MTTLTRPSTNGISSVAWQQPVVLEIRRVYDGFLVTPVTVGTGPEKSSTWWHWSLNEAVNRAKCSYKGKRAMMGYIDFVEVWL